MPCLALLFIKESDDEDYFRDLDIGILLIEHEGDVLTSSQHLSSTSLKVIIEGEVVMDNIQDLPKAMCILFGLTYALRLNYPKNMKLTFQFIQQELLSLGHTDLKPKATDFEKLACNVKSIQTTQTHPAPTHDCFNDLKLPFSVQSF